ncbi:hypothetical protein KUTeg_000751 [Tegillarca granosa]|uniref:Peroxidase n=1 Tax=Tegillarca granosa TaxID=220873 RepID=A0ABQ9FYH6_TEGGR|nr:hypothetical protein KUTeg_000751 [Tegillarca granosa]
MAQILGRINSHWDDERIYQETKKILSAVLQHITYNELLPMILAPGYMTTFGLRSRQRGYNDVYNTRVDPSALLSATSAAMRFPHSNILNHQSLLDRNFTNYKHIATFELFDRPNFILKDNGRDSNYYARWLTSHPMGKSDNFVASAVRQFLFLDDEFHSFDLVSLNIQRGRDNALPSYNQWRKFCGLKPAIHFGKGSGGLIDILPNIRSAFRKVYRHVDDIELFPAGLSEVPVRGGILGPTFSCIVALQHRNLKYGDRFWYERPNIRIGFTLREFR